MAKPSMEANDRAQALFESLLTPAEHEEWKRDGRVTVTGSAGGVYQLVTTVNTMADNVYRIDPETRQRIAVLCAAPNMWPEGSSYGSVHIPIADGWVGQLLALRYNEALFERTACISHYGLR